MLQKDGMNSNNQQFWKLTVPDEHCQPGLEVQIIATESGIEIGGQLIDWGQLEAARVKAQEHLPF